MCNGTASSDWAGGGDDGGVVVDPRGDTGVGAAGIEVGLWASDGCRRWLGSWSGGWLSIIVSGCSRLGWAGRWCGHRHSDRSCFGDVHLSHVLFLGPAHLLSRVFVTGSGRDCCSPAEGRNDAWEGQDAFVILAGGRDLSGYDFPHIESVTCEDNMDEYQPGSVDGLVVGRWHQISFHECVPQLDLRQ
ncbi:hypothetical protein V6N12_051008 [Hibiscus sabdariffa]|uniref:Uncharacterized protein n=1 Tax=Hibiscus sabdariffa TaxID=183260 RepID=A0ABR2GEW8_9ROSI